jgi:plasmid stabilization system protein ParE
VSYGIHPDAEMELGDAACFYTERASKMVATAFLDEFERVVKMIVENQQRGSHGGNGLRLYHFNRFPYTVIYEMDAANGPQIFAVAHQSREPGYWLERASD